MKDKYHLAQINIARMKGVNIDDPVMKGFTDELDRINGIAELSPGFVWRLKDDNNNATSFNPYEDEQILVNVSVWEDLESFQNFVFKSGHIEIMKRRKEWFRAFGNVYTAMWWVKYGEIPDISECAIRLEYLQKNGASDYAFDFRNKFSHPNSNKNE